jgi:predicted NUDIX family NTP pyrophosphohydrolase
VVHAGSLGGVVGGGSYPRVVAAISAGIVLYRSGPGGIEVLLVHPGGPLWARKDLGAWSIPKGEVEQGEDLLAAARREFEEETGFPASGAAAALGSVRQRGGKVVHAWAVRGDADPARLRSNTFEMEWPPRSGKRQEFPEVDRAAWFDLAEAQRRILRAQAKLLDRLAAALSTPA